ncbi:MAG: OB-fold domain-containing protein [Chloroflexi bacterium]|nr:OB-fold domain-containing protein [Chloroflexota bacterium]
MAEYLKPLPDLDNEITRPFWDHIKNHELRMQKCTDCGHVRFPVTPVCTDCLSDSFEWALLSGKGTLWSWNQVYHLYNKGWQDEMPYNVGYVLLDEGIGLITNMVNVDVADLRFDMPVEVVFDDVTPEVTLPKFQPARS